MGKTAFIITLTGPSACGKTYITDRIIDFGEERRSKGIEFKPERFWKYVTRSYRENEIIEKNQGKDIDVEHIESIPPDCDFVYRTYGEEYGLKSEDLKEKLDNNISPIVVINDVRVVEEMKKKFPGQVLSLFIFREIINEAETHINAGKQRGGVSKEQAQKRFEKAIALYRIFIENRFVFDRVILNIPKERTGLKNIDIAKIQVDKVIDGVINEKIDLNNKIEKGPKLFIISGNAQSGKDDVIKASLKMGKIQSEPLIKYTNRWQDSDDEAEIICKYIPKKSVLAQFEKEFNSEKEQFEKEFTFENYKTNNELECRSKYDAKDENFRRNCTFEEYCKALFDLDVIKNKQKIKTPIERFWIKLKEEQNLRKRPNKEDPSKKELLKEAYSEIIGTYFDLNPDYIDLDSIASTHRDEYQKEIEKIKTEVPKGENNSGLLHYPTDVHNFVLYENNKKLYNNPIYYGYELDSYIEKIKNKDKHIVLTASLPNMFKICKEKFRKEKVKTIYTYSQISQEEHLKNADPTTGEAKLQEYDDILRYAYHIVDFDYALIFAETSLSNTTGGQKDELVDQMFRLFRYYNK
jgi:guanylate kinase